ncbi:alpha/beta hydrolase [Sphingomonas sp. 1P08PE]|uniref:alpha/beta hydrolase n=1 Tax=Sphingomonas sp. 1P08PE TaxID=554122 RepID=UPI00399EF775
MRSPRRLVLLLLALASPAVAAPDADGPAIPIWPDGAPGSQGHATEQEQLEAGAYVHNVHRPSLTVSRPDPVRANGAAIVIIPGGGHRMLVFQNEGMVPARALNRYGITSFVLKYRLAREPGSTYTIEGDAAADARRAIRWVRAHAKDYGIDPRRIGVMGFSAGGELVSLVADNPAPPSPPPADAIDRVSSRPDFQVLVYPGPLGTPARSVAGAPPAFIAAGSLDRCCAPPALALYSQLRDAGVSAELHMFASTDHGFNLAMHNDRISIQHWPDRLADWLSDEGWLSAR